MNGQKARDTRRNPPPKPQQRAPLIKGSLAVVVYPDGHATIKGSGRLAQVNVRGDDIADAWGQLEDWGRS